MQLHTKLLDALAQRLLDERQRQGLSREQLAAVCNVSPSFIRDAESKPGRCCTSDSGRTHDTNAIHGRERGHGRLAAVRMVGRSGLS